MSITYSCKCKDVLEKTVTKAYGGKEGKYVHGLVYLPGSWAGKKVKIVLEPEE